MSFTPSSKVKLRPVLPERNGDRYQRLLSRNFGVEETPLVVQAFSCLGDASSPLPNGWCKHVHPEGVTYWHHPENHIVTSSDPRDKAETLIAGRDLLFSRLKSTVPGSAQTFGKKIDSAELFLRVPELEDDVLEYYFADSVARVPFWAEDADVDVLGLSPFTTQEQLKNLMTVQYWCYVDYFPCHRPVDEVAEAELLAILNNLSIDDSTSPGSTSPYGAAECREYASNISSLIFNPGPPESSRPYRVASVARLWTMIARARAINSWGEEDARLDSLQGVNDFLQLHTRSTPVLSVLDAFSFYSAEGYFKQLAVLWNGRIVYARRWDSFSEEMRTEWGRMGASAARIWIANMMRPNASGSTLAATATSAFAGAAVVVSLALLQRHSKAVLSTGLEISALIQKVEHPKHGLRPLAIVYTLPRALTIWAALFFQSQAFEQIAGSGLQTILACIIPLLAMFLAFGVLEPSR